MEAVCYFLVKAWLELILLVKLAKQLFVTHSLHNHEELQTRE